LGLQPIIAPIFTLEALAWEPPPASEFDAVLITSANAARLGGPGLGGFLHLPCHAVGEAAAQAAEEAGFENIRTGPSDGTALLRMMIEEGLSSAFHPHGRDHIPLHHPHLGIVSRAVYVAEAADALPEQAVSGLRREALVLLHSPRAASHFARLLEASGLSKAQVDLALISEQAAMAAGADWRSVSVAPAPRDHALLELAAKLCKD
jgi:uroporphyrinogen-III synthase